MGPLPMVSDWYTRVVRCIGGQIEVPRIEFAAVWKFHRSSLECLSFRLLLEALQGLEKTIREYIIGRGARRPKDKVPRAAVKLLSQIHS